MLLNKDRAQQIMEKYGLDALVATTQENVRYATNFDSDLQSIKLIIEAFAILFRKELESSATLIAPAGGLAFLQDCPTWVPDIRVYGGDPAPIDPSASLHPIEERYIQTIKTTPNYGRAVEALVAVLKEKGVAKGKIGIDELGLLPATRAYLARELSEAVVTDAFGIFHEIRMVKTPEEIDRIRKATEINEAGIHAVIRTIREGISLSEIIASYRETIAIQGGEPRYYQMSMGAQILGIFAPSDYRAQPGDTFLIDPVCTYKGYWSDLGRIVSLGELSKKQQKYFDAIKAGQLTGLEAIRPGLRTSELFKIMMETVRKSGIPNYQRKHTGHSEGLEMYEPPMIQPGGQPNDPFLPNLTDVILEENMILNVETPFRTFGIGAFFLEDTIRVTKTGIEMISTLDPKVYIR